MPNAKELYLYSSIYDFVAEDIISKIEENIDSDIVLRVNSPGGSVFSGWGIIAKMKETENNFKIKVDGWAASMAAFLLLYADDVEALESSKFLLHRADMYVSNDADQEFLNNVNKDLKAAMGKKLNFEKLKELKGVGIEDLFDPKTRIDVILTAKEAKQVGLISKINKISVAEVKALNERFYNVAATATEDTNKNNPLTINTMTAEELKAKHPDVYNSIFTSGVTAERLRVSQHLKYIDVDQKAVMEDIAKGNELSADKGAEYVEKRIQKNILGSIEGGSVKPFKTPEEIEAEKTSAKKNEDAFMEDVYAHLNLKK